ncbi:hypothetical protein [Xenorhabdus lircayensis]|uniref:Fimbrial protein n=1 Tax=Xenorhabdus lircayensis TaxID=2763499 RepID=A0ABS0UBF0_9GAMM|nr:hypothetical protein [Xenorhabdus lircayensis]MBI6550253.1 hypothetical protein [Xenorhabdus lircayensis]
MKRIFFLIFISIWNPVYGGGWGYFVGSGVTNATATYTGGASQNGILKVNMNLPEKFNGENTWINGSCYENKYVMSFAVLNLKKEIKFNINGKMVRAVGMLGENEVHLSKPIDPPINRRDFVSFRTRGTAYGALCGSNGVIGPFSNWFSGYNSVYYKIDDNIPTGYYTGYVNIGTLNAYREPTPQTYYEQYAVSLNYGAQIEVNYTINITNSCSAEPSNKVELKHPNLTTTNFDGNIAKSIIRLRCQNPANISLSLDSGGATGKGSGNKIELLMPTNKTGVSSLLTVEGSNLMYNSSKNKSIITVGSNGEELSLSSMLRKTANNITPGEYLGNAILKIAFD